MRSFASVPKITVGYISLALMSIAAYGCSSGCPVGSENLGDTCRPVAPARDAGVGTSTSPQQSSNDAAHSGSGTVAAGAGGTSSTASGNGSGGSGSSTPTMASTSHAMTGASGGSASGNNPSSSSNGGSSANSGGANNGSPPSASGASGAAAGPSGPCAGHPGEAICEDAVMHHCDASGNVTMSESCMSAQLCQVGTKSGACAACNPGTFHCEDAALQQCSDDGQFVMSMMCSSAALCKEDAGACTAMACMPNAVTCSQDGSMLRTCNADGSAFASQMSCMGKGCDQANSRCNMCVPGSKMCSGTGAVVSCADGQRMEMTNCTASGGDCSTSTCSAGACMPGFKKAGAACSSGGGKVCDGFGGCVGCLTDADCSGGNNSCTNNKCVPKCGNGLIDLGEECDPKVADWSTSTCTSQCKSLVYAACSQAGSTAGCAPGWFCGPNGACTANCQGTPNICSFPGQEGSCLMFDSGDASNPYFYDCALPCGLGTKCPGGNRCVTWGTSICGGFEEPPPTK